MKYKYKTVKGQKVFKVEINMPYETVSTRSCSLYKSGVYVTELKIVHQTTCKIALSDDWITLLKRQESGDRIESYHSYLEHPIINIKTRETYFANGIFGQLYTLKNPKTSIKRLARAIEEEVNKQYGFLSTLNVYEFIENNPITTKE